MGGLRRERRQRGRQRGASGAGFYLNVGGYFSANWDPLYRVPRGEYDVSNNWTYNRGAHSIEFGGELIREQNILAQVFLSQGVFSFNSQISGDNLVDFMLGKPSDFQQFSPIYESLHRLLPALYFNDSWKATRGLTLNLGVRWEPWKMFNEKANQFSSFTLGAADVGVRSTIYPNLPREFSSPAITVCGARSCRRITTSLTRASASRGTYSATAKRVCARGSEFITT